MKKSAHHPASVTLHTPNATRRLMLTLPAAAGAALGVPGMALAAGSNIALLEGEVYVNDHPVDANVGIATGDRIETGATGKVSFSVGDSAFTVRPNSNLLVERGHIFVVAGLRLITGAMVAVFGRGPQRHVSTPNATIGIRGTGVYCETTAGQTYFCTCYGTCNLHAGMRSETVVATHHSPRILGNTMAEHGDIVQAPEANHTDGELEALELLVGRHTPWFHAG
jgi:hypothetical protein